MPANFNFVDTNAMRTAVGRFEETQTGLQSVLRSVETHLATLSASYTGETARQYQQLMQEWTGQCNRISGDLGFMVDNLNQNIRLYEANQSTNQEAVASLRNQFTL
ncbi:WXG100 family type VII secretion target [Kitasatospora sp. NPDC059571]|uniref:WXG100 family type VII secretion target n=1 Tax=Kitasatospora sp. NPDC059571 TaxID=3346871 RepID=UPI0036823C26